MLKNISNKIPCIGIIKKQFVNNFAKPNFFTNNSLKNCTNQNVFKYHILNKSFFKSEEKKAKEKEEAKADYDEKKKEDKEHDKSDENHKEHNKEHHKEHHKEHQKEHNKEHNKEHHKEDYKYKELKESYTELSNKHEVVKKKFEEVRRAYLENQQETTQIIQRNEKEVNNAKVYAISKFAKDLLDVHDNFGRAMNSIEPAEFKNLNEEEKVQAFNTFLEGISMTQEVLSKILKRHGVIEYNPLKEEFNPHNHEAVFDYADDDPEAIPGTVGQVLQSGFKIGDRILRPAKVGVIKKNK